MYKLAVGLLLGTVALAHTAHATSCRDVPDQSIIRMANRSPAMYREDASALLVMDKRYVSDVYCSAIVLTSYVPGRVWYYITPGQDRVTYTFTFLTKQALTTCRGNLVPADREHPNERICDDAEVGIFKP